MARKHGNRSARRGLRAWLVVAGVSLAAASTGCASNPDEASVDSSESAVDALPGEDAVRVPKNGVRKYVVTAREGERIAIVFDDKGINLDAFDLEVTEQSADGEALAEPRHVERRNATLVFHRLRGERARTYAIVLRATNDAVDVRTERTTQVDELGRRVEQTDEMCEMADDGNSWCWSYEFGGRNVVPGICTQASDQTGFGENFIVHFPEAGKLGRCLWYRPLTRYPGRPAAPPAP